MSNTDTPLKREQERELALPRPHPLFFTSIGAGYAFGNDDLGVVTERDAEDLQFSLTTDPEEEDESKQTLAWQRIGWETFTSLNPLRMKHIAQFIGLQPIEGVYSGQNPITSQRSARVFFSPAEENGGSYLSLLARQPCMWRTRSTRLTRPASLQIHRTTLPGKPSTRQLAASSTRTRLKMPKARTGP